jgi:hypothetical protein
MPFSRVEKAMNLQRRLASLIVAISSALVFTNGTMAASGLALKTDLDAKIASVLPDKQEDAWLNIGWHTNLMQAREIAQKENRPLFLWIMNGHPLGCT